MCTRDRQAPAWHRGYPPIRVAEKQGGDGVPPLLCRRKRPAEVRPPGSGLAQSMPRCPLAGIYESVAIRCLPGTARLRPGTEHATLPPRGDLRERGDPVPPWDRQAPAWPSVPRCPLAGIYESVAIRYLPGTARLQPGPVCHAAPLAGIYESVAIRCAPGAARLQPGPVCHAAPLAGIYESVAIRYLPGTARLRPGMRRHAYSERMRDR
jgi:hypothetical protein